MSPRITQLRLSDPLAFASHILRHHNESGASGQLHFSPVWGLERGPVADYCERRLRTPLTAPGWGRGFALWDNDRMVGHAELRGGQVIAAIHRTEFSIGLEQPYRGHGHGRALTQACLSYAFHETAVRFVDLKVFAHNTGARKLYESFGFQQVGLVRDAFRMQDGSSVDDILMVLELDRSIRQPG